MFGVVRDFWSSPGPTSLLKQAHLDLVAQDQVQRVSEAWKPQQRVSSSMETS